MLVVVILVIMVTMVIMGECVSVSDNGGVC